MPSIGPGSLLVSRPPLVEPPFRHTVVLLFQHEAKVGSMGIVVNRCSSMRVADLVDKIEGLNGREDKLWIGGPVQPNAVWVLHRRDDVQDSGHLVAPGVYLGGSPALLRELMQTTPANPAPGVFRVVKGYAGWGAGQLAAEIRDGAWRVTEADGDVIFGAEADVLWDDVLTRAQLPFKLPADSLRNARHN